MASGEKSMPDTQREDFKKTADDNEFGIGQNTDGTFNVFPASELPARLAAQKREDDAFEFAIGQAFPEADKDEDDISDIDYLDLLKEKPL